MPWGEPARLTVPQRTSRAEVERALAEKRSWMEEQRRRQVPRLGLERLAVSEFEARIAAAELVSALAEEEAERIGVAYQRIRIGWAADALGIVLCTRHALLQLAAGAAAAEVLDYVVVHELCHLRVPDHSRRFWALVERHRPHWRHQRDWLRRHGPELLAFRPST